MSSNTKGGDAPHDTVDDGSDATEIVPASTPESDGDGGDTTQILPARSQVESSLQLPGKVIGVAGAVVPAADKDQPADSKLSRDQSAPAPIAGVDDEAVTKILFPSDAQPATTDEPLNDSTSDGLDTRQGAPQNDSSPGSDDEPAPAEEKTVFLMAASKTEAQDDFNPPVGWLVIVDGPGRGAVLNIHYGQNTIGRGEDQHIRLNFGDPQIARDAHAYILYDELARTFFVRDAGKKNLVRINKTPVMTPTQLHSHDQIQIGKTTCLFVPLCTDAFDWLGGEDGPTTGSPEEDKSA